MSGGDGPGDERARRPYIRSSVMEQEQKPVVGYAEKRLQTGGPRRLRIKPLWPLVAPVVVAGGAFVVLVGSATTSTRGGTRSCKLAWEQRQGEIDAVVGGDA